MASRPVRRLVVPFLVAILLSAVHVILAAQGQAPQTFDPQAILPLDPAVRTGKLSNGMTFFVRHNDRPAKRVSLRLAVKSGSLEEADDQQGLAHFIEHMAFNGSAHFKSGEVFSYFESLGARLGPHVNAYTSFDETVYMLDLPTDNAEILPKGLTALADFAGGLSFDPDEVEKERGVVIEEWRGRLGAASRVRDKQIPIIFYNSRYAERVPIGKPEIIRNAPVARLRAFYDTWYRPDRMAVIAVGDIDPAAIQAAIESHFAGLRARAPEAPMPDSSVTLRHPLLVSVVTDPELTQSSVQILRKRAKQSDTRVADYRRGLVERMIERMLNDRLAELARRPDAKFLGASASDSGISSTVDAFSLSARVPDGKLEDGAGVLAAEAKRAREFGFTASELDRAKKWMAAFYEQAYAERDKSESGSFAQEYLSLFLDGEPSPGIEYEYRMVQPLLASVSTEEVSSLTRTLLADAGRVMLAVSPQKEGVKVPTDHELQAALSTAEAVAVAAWNDAPLARSLMDTKPRPASVSSRRELSDVGLTIVKFENGIEAWLKPTTFKNDQIVFTMAALGGASLAPQSDFEEASLAPGYVRVSGVGGLKAVDLQKLLAGKLASASPFITMSTHGISGSASPADLETALQLLYEEFTAPGDDPDAFAMMKRQMEAAVANRGRSPGQVFGERLEQLNTSNHWTSQPLTSERIATLDRQKMLAFYRQRFSNAADFTLFMVGAFRVDDVLPLLAQYVGSLPSANRPKSRFQDIGIRFPSSVDRAVVEMGREPRGNVVLSFFADPPPDPAEQENIAAATTVLDIALRDVLREELGQTYTVSVGLAQGLPQRGGGHIQVSFGAAPENIAPMTDRVLQEIRRLQQEGPSAELTNRAKEAARRSFETAVQQNNYWLGRLQAVRMFERNPAEILSRPDRIAAVTPQTLQEVFRKYFPFDRYTVATLTPAAAAQ
jgi:zinc protease